jgi:hypothetical protein
MRLFLPACSLSALLLALAPRPAAQVVHDLGIHDPDRIERIGPYVLVLQQGGYLAPRPVVVHDTRTGTTRAYRRASAAPAPVIVRHWLATYGPEDVDLNGDGLPSLVWQVFDLDTGRLVVGAGSDGDGGLGDGFFVARVNESWFGADLDGDGVLGQPMVAWDLEEGTRLVAPAPLRRARIGPGYVVAERRELTDLNGDGDANDTFPVIWEPGRTLVQRLLPLDQHSHPEIDPSVYLGRSSIALLVSEVEAGGLDLNGDGDALDRRVLHVHHLASGVTSNTGLAVSDVEFNGTDLWFLVDEGQQGDTNGDGDAADHVLHTWDHGAGVARNLGESFSNRFYSDVHFRDRLMAFSAHETLAGRDLSGDGDATDTVPAIADPTTLDVWHVRIAASWPSVWTPSKLLFTASEALSGTDLNGDGDLLDHVFHLADPATRVLMNSHLPASTPYGPLPVASGERILLTLKESLVGADLDGDGDLADTVPHLWMPPAEPLSLGMAGEHEPSLGLPSFGLFEAIESQQGQDLNGDGDLLDRIPVFFDADSMRTRSLGFPAASLQLSARDFVFPARESALGVDVNEDGILDTTLSVFLGKRPFQPAIRRAEVR